MPQVENMAMRFTGCVVLLFFTASFSSCGYTEQPARDTVSNTGHDDHDILLGMPTKSLKQAMKLYMPGKGMKNTAASFLKGADRAISDEDYDAAAILANQALKLEPTNGMAYYIRGRARCNAVRSNDKEALEDLNKAIEYGAESGRVYESIAKIHDARNEYDKAIEALSKAIKINPNDYDLYKQRAALYADQKDFQNARTDYDKTIELRPTSSSCYFLRAKFLESINDSEAALADYAKSIELEKLAGKAERRVLSHKCRAEIFSRIGKYKEAIADLSSALEMEPKDDELLRLRGNEFAKLKQYTKAIEDYSTAIERAPQFAASSYEARATVYETIGQKNLAAADQKKAKALRDAPAENPLY